MRCKNVLVCAMSWAFLLSSGLVRAQEMSPKELYLKGADNARNCKGYHVSMEFEVTMGEGGMTIPFSGTSTLVNPDLSHSEMEFAGMQVETFTKGEKTIIKNPMTEEWTSPDEMGAPIPTSGLVSPMQQLSKLEKFLDGAKFEADDKVNGDECKVLSFSPPGEALKEVLGDEMGMLQVDLSKAKVMYKIWIDKAATMIRKVSLDAQMSMAGGIPGMPGAGGGSSAGPDEEGDDLTDEGDGKSKEKKDGDKKEGEKKEGEKKEGEKKEGEKKEGEKPKDGDKPKDGEKPKDGDKASGGDEGDGDEGGGDEGGGGQSLSLSGSFNLIDYDKNLEVEIPDPVREKLGMPTLGGGEKKDGDKKDGEKKDGGDKKSDGGKEGQ